MSEAEDSWWFALAKAIVSYCLAFFVPFAIVAGLMWLLGLI